MGESEEVKEAAVVLEAALPEIPAAAGIAVFILEVMCNLEFLRAISADNFFLFFYPSFSSRGRSFRRGSAGR